MRIEILYDIQLTTILHKMQAQFSRSIVNVAQRKTGLKPCRQSLYHPSQSKIQFQDDAKTIKKGLKIFFVTLSLPL